MNDNADNLLNEFIMINAWGDRDFRACVINLQHKAEKCKTKEAQ